MRVENGHVGLISGKRGCRFQEVLEGCLGELRKGVGGGFGDGVHICGGEGTGKEESEGEGTCVCQGMRER